MKQICKCISVILCLAVLTGTFSGAVSAYSEPDTYASTEESEEPAPDDTDLPATLSGADSADDGPFIGGMYDTRVLADFAIDMIKKYPGILLLAIPYSIVIMIEDFINAVKDLFEEPMWKLPAIDAA